MEKDFSIIANVNKKNLIFSDDDDDIFFNDKEDEILSDNENIDNNCPLSDDSQSIDEQLTNNQAFEKQLTNDQAFEKQLTNNQVFEKQLTNNQAFEKQLTNDQVFEKQLTNDQVFEKQLTNDQAFEKQFNEENCDKYLFNENNDIHNDDKSPPDNNENDCTLKKSEFNYLDSIINANEEVSNKKILTEDVKDNNYYKKQLLLNKIKNSKNVELLSKNYNLKSDYDTMYDDYVIFSHIKYKENMINYFKNVILMVIDGLNTMNIDNDPFHIDISDFSKNVRNETIYQIDDALDDLYEKYLSKFSTISPEIKLLSIFAFSFLSTVKWKKN